MSRPAYVAVWVLGSLAFLSLNFLTKTSWFLFSTLRGDWLTVSEKIRYVGNVIGLVIRSDVKAAALTLVTGVLFGAALSLYIFVVRRQRLGRAGTAYPVGGFLSAVLGFGCAACGTLFLSFLGLGAAVTLLPLRGLEFTLLAILLLTVSILRTNRALGTPSCPIHRDSGPGPRRR